jgi:hypothetical protein
VVLDYFTLVHYHKYDNSDGESDHADGPNEHELGYIRIAGGL